MHFLIIYIHFWSSAALVGWLFHSLLLICWSTCISTPQETHHGLVRELPLNWHTQKMNIKPRGLLRWTGSHGGWALNLNWDWVEETTGWDVWAAPSPRCYQGLCISHPAAVKANYRQTSKEIKVKDNCCISMWLMTWKQKFRFLNPNFQLVAKGSFWLFTEFVRYKLNINNQCQSWAAP